MSVRVMIGDWVEKLRELPAESVHCVVTSPPYWRLRDYGVEGQLGLEGTLEEYVEKLVTGFREVRRVLRRDGTLWLNLGDTYAGGGMGGGGSFAEDGVRMVTKPGTDKNVAARKGSRLVGNGLKRKDLCGVPWRVALALQEDGWWLRQDNVWHKPNALPESVTDRSTRAHDYVFMLTRSAKYFYDLEAVKEPVSGTAHAQGYPGTGERDEHRRRAGVGPKAFGANSRFVMNRDAAHAKNFVRANRTFSAAVVGMVAKRNLRSVWTIAARAYHGAHYATFPPALARPCIAAGTSEKGCCVVCGTPWRRVVERGAALKDWQRACGSDRNGGYHGENQKDYAAHGAEEAATVKARILAGMVERKTVGWVPGCKCVTTAEPVPCTVMDPFAGSGTVGEVAKAMGRNAVLIDLDARNVALIEERVGI